VCREKRAIIDVGAGVEPEDLPKQCDFGRDGKSMISRVLECEFSAYLDIQACCGMKVL
jgi:hypothetical protein